MFSYSIFNLVFHQSLMEKYLHFHPFKTFYVIILYLHYLTLQQTNPMKEI